MYSTITAVKCMQIAQWDTPYLKSFAMMPALTHIQVDNIYYYACNVYFVIRSELYTILDIDNILLVYM